MGANNMGQATQERIEQAIIQEQAFAKKYQHINTKQQWEDAINAADNIEELGFLINRVEYV
jgi:hypothetical protein